jgi:hypothetical protein
MSSYSKAAWAGANFGCAVHQEEAAALFDAIPELCSSEIDDLDPDSTLDDWLVSSGHTPFPRTAPSLGARTVHSVKQVLRDYFTRQQLLGPASEACTWDTDTLAARGIRAIINERVRQRGGCACGPPSDAAG